MTRPRIGVALGSGGARGWCHIGVLRELDHLGIRPDIVAGASMGALVGAAYAGGVLDALENWALSLTAGRFMQLVDIRPTGGGLVAGAEIAAVLRDLGVADDIAALQRPFAAVATDMGTGREIWLREGRVTDAVRASVAIPGVIAPAYLDGKWLLDGGMTNPVPVSLARAMGADIILAVNPNARRGGRLWSAPDPDTPGWRTLFDRLPEALRGPLSDYVTDEHPPPPNYLEVVSTSVDIMTERVRQARLAGDPPDAMIQVVLQELTILDMHRAAPAIEAGRRAAAAQAAWIGEICSA